MRIECKKTTELSRSEMEQISSCFGSVFEPHSKSVEILYNQFNNTCLGYSFHTLLKNEEGVVVGAYSVIPFDYQYRGIRCLFSIGMDFMIRKENRNDFRNVLGLCQQSMKYASDSGVDCIFAFPNDLSHQLNIKLLKMKDVGRLNTYLLPYRISSVKPALRFLDIFSEMFTRSLLGISLISICNKTSSSIIHRDRESFDQTRYKWFEPDNYKVYRDDEMKCVWKRSSFNGIDAVFLIDVYPLTPRFFNRATRKMFEAEHKNVGLFIYVGILDFLPISMLLVPKRLAPKKFNFVAKVFNGEKVLEDDVLRMNNWDVNLSSFDLL